MDVLLQDFAVAVRESALDAVVAAVGVFAVIYAGVIVYRMIKIFASGEFNEKLNRESKLSIEEQNRYADKYDDWKQSSPNNS